MQLAADYRDDALDAAAAAANSGLLRVYNGTPPANTAAALSGNTLLAELTLNATAFAAASAGVLTANAISPDASANASGTITFARIYESDGTTVWSQINDVGTTGSGSELEMPSLTVTSGEPVTASALTITWPEGT